MTSPADPAADTFRDLFCRRHRCDAAAFERAVLSRCFPPLASPLGRALLLLRPAGFRRELTLIAVLGQARNESGVRRELEGYVYENQRDKSFRTQTLGLRLSRRRFLRVFREVMGGPGLRASMPSAIRPAAQPTAGPASNPGAESTPQAQER